MAIDTFKWCTQIQNGGGGMTVTNNMRSVVMGNGYRQVASSGLRTNRRQFSVVYGGYDYLEVLDFLYAHVDTPFIWTPPDGRPGVFIVLPDSIAMGPKSRDIQEVTCSFTEQFTSVK